MSGRRLRAMACALSLAAPGAAWARSAPAAAPEAVGPQRTFAPRDIFALQQAGDVEISPDGRRIAYVRTGYDIMTDRARRSVWLVDVATGAQTPLVAGSASSPRWSPDGERIAYVRGSTSVTSTAADAWEAGAGVCQDIAHLAVGALRHVGIPARYVSGYLHPRKDAAIGEPAIGESHAWVEWWLGAWDAHDPTNATAIGERHVIVGRGRDYNDVPPIKGIVAGSARSELEVTVEITRLA